MPGKNETTKHAETMPWLEPAPGKLSRLGFSSLADCLLCVPNKYLDFTNAKAVVDEQMVGKEHFLLLRLRSVAAFDAARNKTSYWGDAIRVLLTCSDAKGTIVEISVFGNIWPWRESEVGEVLYVYGEVSEWKGRLQLASPIKVSPSARGKAQPIYRGKVGQVSGESVESGVVAALPYLAQAGDALLKRAGMNTAKFTSLTGRRDAASLLKSIHRPVTVAEGLQAIATAKSLCIQSILDRSTAASSRPRLETSVIPINNLVVERLIQKLPYALTPDQRTAINEAVRDVRSPFPMRRLLSGDVGTGKSLVFMVLSAAALEAGAQVGIICPNQLMVKQLSKEFREMFPGTPFCEVLAGDKLGQGIAIGTTALLSAARKAKVTFDLVTTDEQQKFSVEQKSTLQSAHTNVMEATATAIPRTTALVSYGGMDLSVLKTCPVDKLILTRLARPHEGPEILDFLHKVVLSGQQVAVVYPLVTKSTPNKDGVEMAGVVDAANRWERFFPGRIGVLHGRMKGDEKDDVLLKMGRREFDILISSTVIEVGVTLPNLRALVVMEPQRHGIAQIHQMRGRVARKGGRGFVFLLPTQQLEPEAAERLSLLTRCPDGFTLAEKDLELRGFGDVDVTSEAQSGATELLFWGVKISKHDLDDAIDAQPEPAQHPVKALVRPLGVRPGR